MSETDKFDEIESIGKKIRQFLESQSYVIHGNNIRSAISEAEDAREYALMCTPTVAGRLVDAQKQLSYVTSNEDSFNALVRRLNPHDLSPNDYRKLRRLLEEYNMETQSIFANGCSCKKQ